MSSVTDCVIASWKGGIGGSWLALALAACCLVISIALLSRVGQKARSAAIKRPRRATGFARFGYAVLTAFGSTEDAMPIMRLRVVVAGIMALFFAAFFVWAGVFSQC